MLTNEHYLRRYKDATICNLYQVLISVYLYYPLLLCLHCQDGSVVLLERKGQSGWIIKCSLVKSGGIPQGILTV